MEKEYILSFSSFYKAAYAEDILQQHGISCTLRKLPPLIAHSCSTGVYLKTDSIEKVRGVLNTKQIATKGIYEISRHDKGEKKYISV